MKQNIACQNSITNTKNGSDPKHLDVKPGEWVKIIREVGLVIWVSKLYRQPFLKRAAINVRKIP